jgi:hypothetical protein
MEAPMQPNFRLPASFSGLVRRRNAPSINQVVLVEPPVIPAKPQPTNQDVLNAIQDLGKKISQLSKNQQALESYLGQIDSTVGENYYNIISAANFGVQWQISLWNLNNGTPTNNPTVQWQ